jgi:hypothetical protein
VPVINHVKREINAKIVYVGPPEAGKKTSLGLVHARLRPECRSEIPAGERGQTSSFSSIFSLGRSAAWTAIMSGSISMLP